MTFLLLETGAGRISSENGTSLLAEAAVIAARFCRRISHSIGIGL